MSAAAPISGIRLNSAPGTTLVRDCMTAPALTVPPEATVEAIARLFEAAAISAAPVVIRGRIVGVVSTTDLVRSLSSGDGGVATAASLMTRPAVVARPDEPLDKAIWRLVAARVHRLVVAENGRPVGILAARYMYEGLLGRRQTSPIGTIMKTPVDTVDLGDSIAHATERLAAANVHGLVVLDRTTPVGVFTHREAIAARLLSPELRERPVEEVMSSETICLNVATPIHRAAAHGMEMDVRRFLVVDRRKLVGILSALDLVGVLAFAGDA